MAELSKDQQDVVDAFGKFLTSADYNEMCIVGGPGNGKTFLTKYLCDYAIEHAKVYATLLKSDDIFGPPETEIFLTSTTNKASHVLAKATGKPTRTVHALLGLRPKPVWMGGLEGLLENKNQPYIPENSIVFIDEAGMVDKGKPGQEKLIHFIDKRLSNCKVVFIGDKKQVLAVHETNCPAFERGAPTFELTTQHRQPSQLVDGVVVMNPIEKLVYKYRDTIDTGIFPKIVPDGEFIIQCTGEEFKERINEYFGGTADHNNKVVCWTNNTTDIYNKHIRSLHTLNEEPFVGEKLSSNKAMFDRAGIILGSGEDVTVTGVNKHTQQHDEVSEGFRGHMITFIDSVGDERCMFLPSEGWKVRLLLKALRNKKEFKELDRIQNDWLDLRSGYASTIQKAQGSTYDSVFINLKDIGACFDPETTARLLVTGISRASKKVFLFGNLPEQYGGF
jgi:exodeoxyribonuclease-5